jgi:uncharacterized protein YkwD
MTSHGPGVAQGARMAVVHARRMARLGSPGPLIATLVVALITACAPYARGAVDGSAPAAAPAPTSTRPAVPTNRTGPEAATIERDTADPLADAVDAGIEAAIARVHAEANAVRQTAGRRPLCQDYRLAEAASTYAAELARRRRLSHESDTRGLETPAARANAAGGRGWRLIGENLASVSVAERDPARVAVQLWIDSPGHHENLIRTRFNRAGTGAALNGGNWYFVQLYGDYPETEPGCG